MFAGGGHTPLAVRGSSYRKKKTQLVGMKKKIKIHSTEVNEKGMSIMLHTKHKGDEIFESERKI